MKHTLIDALYCRVSTEMQRDKGESIDNQISRLKEYAKEKHLNFKVYEDAGYSAKDTNRPAVSRLLTDIKDGKVQSVIVTKLDRITRSIKDLLDLLELFEKHEVAFKSITQPLDTASAMGRGFLRLLGEFAQMEREMVSERVGEDMRHRAKSGKWNGGIVPFGYAVYAMVFKDLLKSGLTKEQAERRVSKIAPEKKKLFVNPDEARIIKKIYEKYLRLESIRGVTHWLNSRGYRTRKRITWSSVSVSRILTNPTYIGKLCYNKRVSSKTTGKLKKRPEKEWIICDGQHDPIIRKAMFDRAQRILERQKREPRRKMSEYLLSGLVRCGHCGGSLNGYTQRKKTAAGEKLYSYYKCHTNQSKGRSVCSGTAINKERLEKLVIDKILSLSESKGFKIDAKKALEEFNKRIKKEDKPLREGKKRLEMRNADIERKKRSLLECLEDKAIDKETYKKRTTELNEEFEKNQTRLYGIDSKLNDMGIEDMSFKSVYEALRDFKSSWDHLEYIGKKDLLWALVSKITVKEKEINVELFFLPSIFSNLRLHTGRGSSPRSA